MTRFVFAASIALATTAATLSAPPAHAQYRDCRVLSHDYESCMECGSDWPRDVQHKWCVRHGFPPSRAKASQRRKVNQPDHVGFPKKTEIA